MKPTNMQINHKRIGPGQPVYVIAEMSANHHQDYNTAVQILKEAKSAGADAVKLQTYTPDTLTIDCSNKHFLLTDTIWKGKTLYELYSQAATPWEWIPGLKKAAAQIGIDLFSTPFDSTAVDFLEKNNMPAYKIASFEIVDIPLLKKVAVTGKPVFLSTGMATFEEIKEAVATLNQNGSRKIALLKCTSAYPASPKEAHLKTIPDLSKSFNLPVGISDHTLGDTVSLGAVALGAGIVEKHFTLSRDIPGPDSSFSMEPDEFKKMVSRIRTLEASLGSVCYKITQEQKQSLVFRKSLFVVCDMKKGEIFTPKNVRSIRPSIGMHPRYFEEVLGKKAQKDILRGTPLKTELIE